MIRKKNIKSSFIKNEYTKQKYSYQTLTLMYFNLPGQNIFFIYLFFQTLTILFYFFEFFNKKTKIIITKHEAYNFYNDINIITQTKSRIYCNKKVVKSY